MVFGGSRGRDFRIGGDEVRLRFLLCASETQGLDVTRLQRDLTAAGFTTVSTGIFTQQTKSHVKAFQRRYGLSVDGVVGPFDLHEADQTLLHRLATMPDTALAASGAQTATTATTPAPLPPSDSGCAGLCPRPPTPPVSGASPTTN